MLLANMAPFNHFDFLAPIYDRLVRPSDPTRLINLLGLPSSGILLDIGGGTGRISYPLVKTTAGVVIADSSLGMLTQANKKDGLVTLCSESERLPFEDNVFEREMMVDALHHVSDYQLTTHEMWRVLKSGGRIVVEEPDIDMMPIKVMALIEKLALMRSHFISPARIAASFGHPTAVVSIVRESSTVWIVIDKRE